MDLKTKLSFWQTWLATLLFFGGFYTLTAQLPLYLSAVKIPDWQIGFISGAFGISSLVTRPLAGWLCDRVGTYKVISGSVILFLGGVLPLSLSSDLWFLLVLRVLQASGYVGFTTAGTTIIIKLLNPALRERWLAWYGAAANLAVTVTPLALDLSRARNNSEISFYLAALLASFGLALLIWTKELRPVQNSNTNLKLYQTLKFVVLPGTFAFVAGVCFGTFLQFTPLLADEAKGISTGLIYTSYGISIILVRLLMWRTLSATFQRIVLPLGFGLLATGLATFAFSPAYEFYLLGAAILAFGSGMQTPILIGLHLNALPSTMQGRAVALYYLGFDGGIGLGTWLLTPVLAIWGLQGLFAGAALTALIGLIIWLGFNKRTGVKNAN
jgi:MFS family permease